MSGAPTGTLRFSAVRAGVESADPVQRRHRRSCIEAGHHGDGHHGDGRRAATDRRYPVWQHTGPGGARASVLLIPQVLRLMAQAGLSFDRLDALVFGRGPGSFTGLRTASAAAPGAADGGRRGPARPPPPPPPGPPPPPPPPPPAGPWPAMRARAMANGWRPPPAMCWRCPRPRPCCAWRPARSRPVAACPPAPPCRAISAIKWRTPRPNGPPCGPPTRTAYDDGAWTKA